MSVYSGFATRQQESFYDKLIFKALQLMGMRLISFFKNEGQDDVKWARQLRKLFKYQALMDKTKYLEPKFSEAMQPISAFLKEHLDIDSKSSVTSNLSHFLDTRSEMSMRMQTQPPVLKTQLSNPVNFSPDLSPIKNELVSQINNNNCNSRNQSSQLGYHTMANRSKDFTSARQMLNKTQVSTHNKGMIIENQEKPLKKGKQWVKLKKRNALDSTNIPIKNMNNTMRQANDSHGNIVEQQEEEDDLASSSRCCIQESVIKTKGKDMDQPKQAYGGSSEKQREKMKMIEGVRLNNKINRKFTSQPRGTVIRKSEDKESLHCLPDIAGRQSHATRRKFSRNTKLSSISSQSARSTRSITENLLNSTRNNNSHLMKQSYQGSFNPPQTYYTHDSGNKKFRSKYIKNVMRLDNPQQRNTFHVQQPSTGGQDVAQNAITNITTTKSKRRTRKIYKSVYKQPPGFSFVSPLRGVTSAAVPTNNQRGVSSSPYQHKKRSEHQTERKATEETKMSGEYKKRHDLMKKKLDKAQKEKQENVNQLKSLFVLFTQQRKALEVSIQKSKKLDEDNNRLEVRNRNLEEQHQMFYSRIEQLEADREMLFAKHKRDKDQLENEIDEKRQMLKQYEHEFREIGNQKLMMKKQLEEYESKIKKLIIEFEEESKKHIRELNEVHGHYREYKSNAQEYEQRIQQYKVDQQKALQGEREAKIEGHRLRLENDELLEQVRFLDQRYNTLIQRLGASEEDIQAIDQMVGMANYQQEEEDDEAQVIHSKKKSKNRSQHSNNKRQQNNQKDLQKYDNQNNRRQQNDQNQQQQQMMIMDDEYEDEEEAQQLMEQQRIKGVISGEQTIEQSDNRRNEQKKTNIEILDDENTLEEYQLQKYEDDEEDEEQQEENDSQSGDLLKKLIENISGNAALQNQYIKDQFKLDQITSEADLHDYKNLLNSMAALFYTNHRLNDVTILFYMWREAALAKQKEKAQQEQQDKQKNQSSSKKTKVVPPLDIKIDTELANKDMYKNYQGKNKGNSSDEESFSEIEKDQMFQQNMMIHIEGDDSNILRDDEDTDEDLIKDKQTNKFLADLKQVGPYSKQILNYTYPPLLYQRGDENYDDEDDDGNGLPDLEQDFSDKDEDIQELIQGGGLNNQDLYSKLQNVVKDKEAQKYVEQIYDDGNVYLVDGSQNFDEYGEEDMNGQPIVQEGYLDDEEFLEMMEQEAAEGRKRNNGLEQQHSAIIDSQNSSQEDDNFIDE